MYALCLELHVVSSGPKRKYPRYLLSTHLSAVPDTELPKKEYSRALDISEGGVGGVFQESWGVGTRVRLELSLPVEPSPLQVAAIVRHHTGARYGFEFIDLSQEERGIVRKACEALSRRVPGAS